jgi:hypothetical protein
MSWLMILGIQTLFPDPLERNDTITIIRSELYARALPTGRNGDDTYQLDVGLLREILIQKGAMMGLSPI